MKFSLSSEFTRTFNYRKYLNIRLSGLYIVKKMRSVNNIQTLSSFNFSQKTKTKKNSTILTENNHFEDLIKWSQENNSSINYLKLKEISSDNRCLVADRKIKKGEVITSIPEKLIFSSSFKFPELFKYLKHNLNFSDVDTIYICLKTYILLRMEKRQDFFFKYLQFMPKNLDEFPHFYNKSELALLNKSFFMEDLKNNLKSDFNDFQQLCKHFPELKRFEKWEYIKVSLIVNSRVFYLENNGKEEYMMVPISDLFNHSFYNNAHWRFNDNNKSFEIYSTKAVNQGEEISLSYGEKGNLELLLNYGFTFKSNPYGERSVYYYCYLEKELKDIIEITEKLRDNSFEIEINYSGNKVINSLKEMRKIMYIYMNGEVLDEKIDLSNPFDIENEENVINVMIKTLGSIFNDYPTKLNVINLFIKDDIKLSKSKSISMNVNNILNVLIEEKTVFNSTKKDDQKYIESIKNNQKIHFINQESKKF